MDWSKLAYKFRWWLLGTVVLLNLANYAHWIAFPAVAKKVTTSKIGKFSRK